MTAMVAASPVHGAAFKSPFKSPLRSNFSRPEASERVASDEVYGDAQARMVQWRKDFLGVASFEAQQGLRELSHEQEHLKDLQSDLAGLQGLVQVASNLHSGGARLAEVLNSSSDAAATRAQAVAQMSDELRERSESQQEELQKEEHNISLQREVADAQHTEALKLLNVYKDRLGLAITRVAPQTVHMSFSLIDESHPTKEFGFTLGLADSNSKVEGYSVLECIPHVPVLPKLLDELNSTASSSTALPRFVCSMRRAFLESTRNAQES